MKVGLYNLEPRIVNSAMMQVSTYHKERGDEVKRYNLGQLSVAKKPTQTISFRFKYFQNLSGEMRLPEGFEPTKVMLTLNPKGKKFKKSVEQFDWIVEES